MIPYAPPTTPTLLDYFKFVLFLVSSELGDTGAAAARKHTASGEGGR